MADNRCVVWPNHDPLLGAWPSNVMREQLCGCNSCLSTDLEQHLSQAMNSIATAERMFQLKWEPELLRALKEANDNLEQIAKRLAKDSS